MMEFDPEHTHAFEVMMSGGDLPDEKLAHVLALHCGCMLVTPTHDSEHDTDHRYIRPCSLLCQHYLDAMAEAKDRGITVHSVLL